MGVPLNGTAVGNGAIYLHHPDHRNGNPQKSQWTILERQELDVFTVAMQSNWLFNNKGWGLYKVEGALRYLGINRQRDEDVFVARFVGQANNWHGYPADRENRSDRPPLEVRRRWISERTLPRPKIRKLGAGERCAL